MVDSIFAALTSGITFKKERQDCRKTERERTIPYRLDSKSAPQTNDPQEAFNVIRKHHHIRVQGNCIPAPVETFEELEQQTLLPGVVCRRLKLLGLTAPTSVQVQALPALLCKRDVIAISPTGSGKTLAFLLPIITDTAKSHQQGRQGVLAIMIAPSRELAQQTARVMAELSQDFKLHSCLLSKASAAGEDFGKVDAIIATPLRLSRMLKAKGLKLDSVQHLVLDEADKLLEHNDRGSSFVHQVDAIVAVCTNPKLVISMFSATLPEKVEQLAKSILRDPIRVTVGAGGRDAAARTVTQRLQYVGTEEGKFLTVQQMLQTGLKAPVLIFVASKEKAVLLHRRLLSHNIRVDVIFSSQDYSSRQNALDSFRAGETWLLISTDVLARGIDFVGVKTVICYDCPRTTQDYIHRVGRTGRAGHAGEAITFFTEDDLSIIRSIANIILEAGQEVPGWMLKRGSAIQKSSSNKKKRKKQKVAGEPARSK